MALKLLLTVVLGGKFKYVSLSDLLSLTEVQKEIS